VSSAQEAAVYYVHWLSPHYFLNCHTAIHHLLFVYSLLLFPLFVAAAAAAVGLSVAALRPTPPCPIHSFVEKTTHQSPHQTFCPTPNTTATTKTLQPETSTAHVRSLTNCLVVRRPAASPPTGPLSIGTGYRHPANSPAPVSVPVYIAAPHASRNVEHWRQYRRHDLARRAFAAYLPRLRHHGFTATTAALMAHTALRPRG